MTKREAYEKHQMLWNEVARIIREGVRYECELNYKECALNNLGFNDTTYYCYACEVSDCNDCLVVWNGKNCYKGGEYALFCTYIKSGRYYLAAEMAEKIANLPLRRMDDLDEEVDEEFYKMTLR